MQSKKVIYPLLYMMLIFAAHANADMLVLLDGRVIEECKIRKAGESEDAYFIIFPHGRLKIEADRIKEIFIESSEDYIPRNEFEREQIGKGLVLFEGLWRTKKKRDALIEERRKQSRERLERVSRHLEWENAWEREKPDFKVVTNTSPELLEYYTEVFESFYGAFMKRWGGSCSKSDKQSKPTISIYRSRLQYLMAGAASAMDGFFDAETGELKLYHDSADPRSTLDVLFHEGTHLLVHQLRPDFIFPIWVNEGLAEYYGASVVDESRNVAVGGLQEGRLAELRYALSEGKYIPLEKVLLTPQVQFGQLHYAEAWCLVHFLLSHERYKAKFSGFVSALATGTDLQAQKGDAGAASTVSLWHTLRFFKDRLGIVSLSPLNREFLEYVYYGLPEVGARGYVASARNKIRNKNNEEGLADLETALRLGSKDPNCFLYKARIYAVEGRIEEAAVAYMHTIEMDPLNPDYHHEAGQALRSSEDEIMMREGLRQLYLATEIAPADPRFLKSLGMAIAGDDLKIFREVRERLKKLGGGAVDDDDDVKSVGEGRKTEGS